MYVYIYIYIWNICIYIFHIVVCCLVAKLYPTSFVTPWTVAHQIPLSMEFSRQEYWSGLPFTFLEDLPDPGLESGSPTLQGDSLLTELPGKP